MNARVFLLVLVTGLFMAAWNGDQAAKQEFLAQRARQRAASALAATESDRAVEAGTEVQLTGHTPAPSVTRQVVSQFRPDGMASGTYRAVSQTGTTFELTVDNNDAATARDFYVADSPAGTRWYFILVHAGS